jgi:hypothetical protein
LRKVGVDPDRRGIDDPPDAGAAGGLQDVQRSSGVHLLRLAGPLEHGVDVRERGQMRDHLAALARMANCLRIPDVADVRLDLVRRVVRRGPDVEDPDIDSGETKPVDDV